MMSFSVIRAQGHRSLELTFSSGKIPIIKKPREKPSGRVGFTQLFVQLQSLADGLPGFFLFIE